MGNSGLQIASWNLAWGTLRRKLRPLRQSRDCGHGYGLWRRLRGAPGKILVRGSWYCADACLDQILSDTIQQMQSAAGHTSSAAHRVPLGLLLLSRQQITAEKLRIAIEAQRFAGRGRIGEWFQTLGFADEHQVTAALARQWACPIRRVLPSAAGLIRAPEIPIFLMQSSAMIPVEYVESTATLHIAFGEGIDRNLLYAIEQMLECRTEPCLVVPSLLHQSLRASFERRGPREVVFDRMEDIPECVRIIRSYGIKICAHEVRLVTSGPCLWIRLLSAAQPPLDLLFRNSTDPAPRPPLTQFPALVPPPKVQSPLADGN